MKRIDRFQSLAWMQRLMLIFGLGILLPLVSFQAASAFSCNGIPARPKLQTPSKGESLLGKRVQLAWERADCATHYVVVVRKSASYGRPVDAAYDLKRITYTTRRLDKNASYWWMVEACNANGCSTSRWGRFSIGN